MDHALLIEEQREHIKLRRRFSIPFGCDIYCLQYLTKNNLKIILRAFREYIMIKPDIFQKMKRLVIILSS
jgi:hypothetical protein